MVPGSTTARQLLADLRRCRPNLDPLSIADLFHSTALYSIFKTHASDSVVLLQPLGSEMDRQSFQEHRCRFKASGQKQRLLRKTHLCSKSRERSESDLFLDLGGVFWGPSHSTEQHLPFVARSPHSNQAVL